MWSCGHLWRSTSVVFGGAHARCLVRNSPRVGRRDTGPSSSMATRSTRGMVSRKKVSNCFQRKAVPLNFLIAELTTIAFIQLVMFVGKHKTRLTVFNEIFFDSGDTRIKVTLSMITARLRPSYASWCITANCEYYILHLIAPAMGQ